MSATTPAAILVLAVLVQGGTGSVREQEAKPEAPTSPKRPVEEVVNTVSGRTFIVRLEPQGKRVTKGQIICVLDTTNLKEAIVLQEISTHQAEADLRTSQLAREVAEIARNEYLEGVFPQAQQAIEGQIQVAKAELSLTQDQRKTAKDDDAKKQADISIMRAELALTEAQKRLDVLLKYTQPRQVKKFEADVEKTKTVERLSQDKLNHEKARAEALKKQIDGCVIRAPIDGTLVYIPPTGPRDRKLEEGAPVHERQTLFRIVGKDEPKSQPADPKAR